MRKKSRILISVLILLIVAIAAVCAYFYHTISTVVNVDTICEGIRIDGCAVGGLTREEAAQAVQEYEQNLADIEVEITYDDQNEIKTLEQLGYSYSGLEDAVNEAYKIGREGNIWTRYKIIKEGAGADTEFVLEKSISEGDFKSYIEDNADQFVKVAKNAKLKRENGEFVITDEQNGMEVPISENVEKLNEYLNQTWDYNTFTYELAVEVAEPEYTREDLEKVNDVLGEYTTNFSSSGYNRVENIKTACKKINGNMIYPGDEFSVMDQILPFTAENGYYEAGSYSQGEVIQSYGGGVCQVATTLYNSVLLAELEVTERYNHQMVVSYVPLSRDAAVSDTGNQDFKFVNNTEYPIYIEGYLDGANITFRLYGCETRDSNRKVEYVSEQTETIQPGKDIETKDDTLAEGQKIVTQSAHTGYRAKLWKKVYVDGEVDSETQVNSSYYAASARRVTVGTKKKEEDKSEESEKNKTDKKKNSSNNTTDDSSKKNASSEEETAEMVDVEPIEVEEDSASEETEAAEEADIQAESAE